MKFKSAKTVLMDRRTPKQKRIDRSLEVMIPDEVWDALEKELAENG